MSDDTKDPSEVERMEDALAGALKVATEEGVAACVRDLARAVVRDEIENLRASRADSMAGPSPPTIVGMRDRHGAEWDLTWECWDQDEMEGDRSDVEVWDREWPDAAPFAPIYLDREADTPEPELVDEIEELEVVAFRQFDGGHWYYEVGHTSDPRAEHLVRAYDATTLLAEKDMEIERLREHLDRWLESAESGWMEVHRLRARITELEAREVTAGMIEAASRSYLTDAPGDADYWEWQADRINAALRSDSEEVTNDR